MVHCPRTPLPKFNKHQKQPTKACVDDAGKQSCRSYYNDSLPPSHFQRWIQKHRSTDVPRRLLLPIASSSPPHLRPILTTLQCHSSASPTNPIPNKPPQKRLEGETNSVPGGRSSTTAPKTHSAAGQRIPPVQQQKSMGCLEMLPLREPGAPPSRTPHPVWHRTRFRGQQQWRRARGRPPHGWQCPQIDSGKAGGEGRDEERGQGGGGAAAEQNRAERSRADSSAQQCGVRGAQRRRGAGLECGERGVPSSADSLDRGGCLRSLQTKAPDAPRAAPGRGAGQGRLD